MSAAKYANLPDIDLEGNDVYETPDVAPEPTEVESDEEVEVPRVRTSIAHRPGQAELDNEPLPSTEASGRFFRHAERRARRQRELYSYPDSSYSSSRSPSPSRSNLPLAQRIELMKNELAQLEAEAAGDTDPKDEPTELIRELSGMRGRLAGIGSRARLISAVANNKTKEKEKAKPETDAPTQNVETQPVESEISRAHGGGVVDIDRRIAQLEKLIGASGTSLDESSPLPQPLLPHLTRISTLLTLLAQPRHIDSISRRLKLLLTDLERYNASAAPSAPGGPLSPALAELAPLLQRLAPHITTIPAVLSRLRTLSALHASAAGFGDAVSGLEEDQRRLRAGLADLEEAVKGLEDSITDNSGTISRNVEGLETRIASLEERLAGLSPL
ncbi:putative dynactin subunit 2 [Drosophila pseudoobscura pseudoobscura] [Rhizoctonia solani]|uniref:Putative dynactin subunit 2 [Drosophila pseudoobscura pseudoobscura] n=1 Tax=Rhizoctonia solani TaxID=456999 RepID=A0A0K6FWE8_9AGAM|nr:putative dynactin subunit 2 [Drosophila pseudoobscura pseudoobscura] [Rhizoctonia solani]